MNVGDGPGLGIQDINSIDLGYPYLAILCFGKCPYVIGLDGTPFITLLEGFEFVVVLVKKTKTIFV